MALQERAALRGLAQFVLSSSRPNTLSAAKPHRCDVRLPNIDHVIFIPPSGFCARLARRLLAHVVAGVSAWVLAQVVLVIVLRAVPRGRGLDARSYRPFPFS